MIELQVFEGVYPEATDVGVLFQKSLKAAGIDMTVERVSVTAAGTTFG